MVTKILTSVKAYDSDGVLRNHYEYRGLASDEKPIEGVQNGEAFYEMDTLSVHMFDEENLKWCLQRRTT